MDFLKKLPNRIKSFFGNKEKRKYFIIIGVAVIVLAAVPFTLRALHDRLSYMPVYTPVYPQTPPPKLKGFIEQSSLQPSLERSLMFSDRFVKLTILREMAPDEYQSIPGMFKTPADLPRNKDGSVMATIDGYPLAILNQFLRDDIQYVTFFEAVITYDYFTGKNLNEKIIVPYDGTHQYQVEDEPIYQPGEEYAIFLEKVWPPKGPLYFFSDVFDVQKDESGEILLKRGGKYKEEIPDMAMSGGEQTRITSTKENPAYYSQKFKADDFTLFVKQFRDKLVKEGKLGVSPEITEDIISPISTATILPSETILQDPSESPSVANNNPSNSPIPTTEESKHENEHGNIIIYYICYVIQYEYMRRIF